MLRTRNFTIPATDRKRPVVSNQTFFSSIVSRINEPLRGPEEYGCGTGGIYTSAATDSITQR